LMPVTRAGTPGAVQKCTRSGLRYARSNRSPGSSRRPVTVSWPCRRTTCSMKRESS
jgi:hypothetical protein